MRIRFDLLIPGQQATITWDEFVGHFDAPFCVMGMGQDAGSHNEFTE